MIELSFLKRYESINKLIEFGKNGYYPLFDSDHYKKVLCDKKMTKLEKLKAKGLFKKMSGVSNLNDQKILFLSFKKKEKEIVMKVLIELVEGKILDGKPQIQ